MSREVREELLNVGMKIKMQIFAALRWFSWKPKNTLQTLYTILQTLIFVNESKMNKVKSVLGLKFTHWIIAIHYFF